MVIPLPIAMMRDYPQAGDTMAHLVHNSRRQTLRRQALSLSALLVILTGCDINLDSQMFKLQMIGVEIAPEGAEGTASPRAVTYQLSSLTFIGEEGTEDLDLTLEDPTKTYRIASRPQILYSQKLKDYTGNSYSGVRIGFETAAQAEAISGQTYDFTLSSPELTSPGFLIKQGRDINVVIKVQWKNTLTDDALTEPGYEVTVGH